jgi:hypothetical protein
MLDMSDDTLTRVQSHFEAAVTAHRNARELLAGRNAKIISDYNGQPYGSSRKSMKGQVLAIEDVYFDMHWGISVRLHECTLFIRLEEIELV